MPRHYYGDRFIPNRSAMDFDTAHYLLVGSKREKREDQLPSLATVAYRKRLLDAMMINTERVLSFWNRPEKHVAESCEQCLDDEMSRKPKRYISKFPERSLSAPNVLNDFHLNLVDWSINNVIAIALENQVYLWNSSRKQGSVLMDVDEDIGPITSVNWHPGGQHIAVGLNNSTVEIWNATSLQKVRTLDDGHQARVGSLAWNDNILTTGGMDSKIINNDARIGSHIVHSYKGHKEEVCNLKWSNSGHHLASGGSDNLLYVWDKSMASSNSPSKWLHEFKDSSTVKALAWCPLKDTFLLLVEVLKEIVSSFGILILVVV